MTKQQKQWQWPAGFSEASYQTELKSKLKGVSGQTALEMLNDAMVTQCPDLISPLKNYLTEPHFGTAAELASTREDSKSFIDACVNMFEELGITKDKNHFVIDSGAIESFDHLIGHWPVGKKRRADDMLDPDGAKTVQMAVKKGKTRQTTYGTDAYIRYCDYDVDFSFKSGPSEKNRYYGDADSVHPHFRDFSYKRLQNTVATALALNAPRRWTSVMGAIPAALVWDTLSECLESSMDLVATSVFVEIPTPAFDSLGLEAGVSLYELVIIHNTTSKQVVSLFDFVEHFSYGYCVNINARGRALLEVGVRQDFAANLKFCTMHGVELSDDAISIFTRLCHPIPLARSAAKAAIDGEDDGSGDNGEEEGGIRGRSPLVGHCRTLLIRRRRRELDDDVKIQSWEDFSFSEQWFLEDKSLKGTFERGLVSGSGLGAVLAALGVEGAKATNFKQTLAYAQRVGVVVAADEDGTSEVFLKLAHEMAQERGAKGIAASTIVQTRAFAKRAGEELDEDDTTSTKYQKMEQGMRQERAHNAGTVSTDAQTRQYAARQGVQLSEEQDSAVYAEMKKKMVKERAGKSVAGHKKKRDTKQVVGGKFFANPGRFFRPEFQKLVHARLTKKATNFTRPIIRKEIGAWLRRLFDSPAGLRLIGSPKPFVHGNSKGFLAVGLADCGFELHALPSDDADFLAEWVRAKNDINRWKDDDLVKVETWGLEWFVMALLSGRIGLHKVKNGKVVGTALAFPKLTDGESLPRTLDEFVDERMKKLPSPPSLFGKPAKK